jgi:predicted transcriptional regulator
MANKEYQDQLNSPEWKAKRKEILIRDGNKCKLCGSINNLQVHHLEYENGKFAWEYDNDKLITLCKNCHKKQHKKHLNVKTDSSVQIYYDELFNYISNIRIKSIHVLFAMLQYLEYDTGMVYLTSNRRSELSNILNISKNQISSSIKELTYANLIYGQKGSFRINPVVFWYGKRETRISILLSITG